MIYLIESGDYYKIGYTSDWVKRSSAYECNNPNYKLISIKDGDFEDETYLHRCLKQYLFKNEWYYKNEEVLNVFLNYKKCKINKYNYKARNVNSGVNTIKIPYHLFNIVKNPNDYLVYICIQHLQQLNKSTSLKQIQLLSKLSILSIRKSISNLVQCNILSLRKELNRQKFIFYETDNNVYIINSSFLYKENLTVSEKEYLIVAKSLMYKNGNSNYITNTDFEISKTACFSRSAISKLNKSLVNKGYLKIYTKNNIKYKQFNLKLLNL